METKTILIAYTTNAGTTAEVAQAVGEELAKNTRLSVDVKRLEEVESIEPYSAVVIGAPMIFGWHRGARKFIKQTPGLSQQDPRGLFHHSHEPD